MALSSLLHQESHDNALGKRIQPLLSPLSPLPITLPLPLPPPPQPPPSPPRSQPRSDRFSQPPPFDRPGPVRPPPPATLPSSSAAKSFSLQTFLVPHIITERFNVFKMVLKRGAGAAAYSPPSPESDYDSEPEPAAAVHTRTPTAKSRSAASRAKSAAAAATSSPAAASKTSTPKNPTTTRGGARAHNPGSGGSAPRSRVVRGKAAVGKTYRAAPTPQTRRLARPGAEEDELISELNRETRMSMAQCEQDMVLERTMWPGSEAWSLAENMVFESLFMMQFRPSLPRSWAYDLRGIPALDEMFASSDGQPTPIYAHSDNNYRATRAFRRLIALTADIRSLIQSGHKEKTAAAIRVELSRYIQWAAKDGGFDNLDAVPTVLLAIIDSSLTGAQVTEFMQARMKELAESHRLWVAAKREEPQAGEGILQSVEDHQGGSSLSAAPSTTPTAPLSPPVIVGLFIISSIVVVATADSSKTGAALEVNILVEARFNQSFRGIWNALMVAIPVCMARDEMIKRKASYQHLGPKTQTDPDL